jgi:hypothetical protein
MTKELAGLSQTETLMLKQKYANSSDALKKRIDEAIGGMHTQSLMQLIVSFS